MGEIEGERGEKERERVKNPERNQTEVQVKILAFSGNNML